jgi:hypothetical protein
MTAPLSIVVIAVLVGLLLGVCIGLWLASLEWMDSQEQHARDWHSRHVGPGMPTEEAESEDELRRRGWL